jgi:hypothetical protein
LMTSMETYQKWGGNLHLQSCMAFQLLQHESRPRLLWLDIRPLYYSRVNAINSTERNWIRLWKCETETRYTTLPEVVLRISRDYDFMILCLMMHKISHSRVEKNKMLVGIILIYSKFVGRVQIETG